MRRPQSSFLSKMDNAVRFLLFLEKDPKHRVAQDLSPILISLLPIVLIVMGYLSFLTIQYGLIIIFSSAMLEIILFLEFFHLIYDR